MNWDDLRIFLAIARTGTISGAARSMDVQHSTVSRRLQQLEKKLAARLVDKKRSGYTLTDAGEQLRQAAIRMEREVLAVDGALTGNENQIAGKIVVAAPPNMATSFLMPIFARFSQRYPKIEIEISISNIVVSLVEREADVAIRLTNEPTDTLIGKKLATIASTVYGSRRYLSLLREQKKTPDWIGVNCCQYHRHWTRELAGATTNNLIVDDALLTRDAIKQDLGLAILPCYLGDADTELERYTQPQPEMDLELWFLYHVDLRNSERIRLLRTFIFEEFEKLQEFLQGKPITKNS
jgi:molybdate transport repressor ModE-like protein